MNGATRMDWNRAGIDRDRRWNCELSTAMEMMPWEEAEGEQKEEEEEEEEEDHPFECCCSSSDKEKPFSRPQIAANDPYTHTHTHTLTHTHANIGSHPPTSSSHSSSSPRDLLISIAALFSFLLSLCWWVGVGEEEEE